MSFTESIERLVEENPNGLLGAHPSWARARLREFATVLNGFAFASSGFNDAEGLPLVRIRDLESSETATRFRGEYDDCYLVRTGDLLVGMDGDFKCSIWKGGEALLNQRVCKIEPNEAKYSKQFLSYCLPGYLNAIHGKTSSITVKHLSSRTLLDLPLPSPPLPVQREISAQLDSYFSRLDEVEVGLKRVQRNLKRYRASVLQAAVTGRLVPTEAELARAEGREYEPAFELLKRILVERRKKWEESGRRGKYGEPAPPGTSNLPELPEGWCWATVDQVADVGTGATPKRGDPRYWQDGTVPWVTSAVVNAPLVTSPSEYVTEAALRETNLTLYRPGTILVAMYGEGHTRGRASVLGIEATTNQALAALTLARGNAALRTWVLLSLQSAYQSLRSTSSGGVQPNLNLGLVKQTLIALPPAREAERITTAVSSLLSVSDTSEAAVGKQIALVSRLRQSILRSAFEGHLTNSAPNGEPMAVRLLRVAAGSAPAAIRHGRPGRRR